MEKAKKRIMIVNKLVRDIGGSRAARYLTVPGGAGEPLKGGVWELKK